MTKVFVSFDVSLIKMNHFYIDLPTREQIHCTNMFSFIVIEYFSFFQISNLKCRDTQFLCSLLSKSNVCYHFTFVDSY